MATNDRVQNSSGDIRHEQLVFSQLKRTNFTPGKVTGRSNDANWPKDFKIPTGTPAFDGEAAGPVVQNRVIITKLGRNVVSDQTILEPITSKTRVESRTEDGISGGFDVVLIEN